MKKTAFAGIGATLTALGIWLYSSGIIGDGFIYWILIALLVAIGSLGVSWGMTEMYVRVFVGDDKRGHPANKKKIYCCAVLTALVPAGSACIGFGMMQNAPYWYWFITPFIALLIAGSSPWAWKLVFEIVWPKIAKALQ